MKQFHYQMILMFSLICILLFGLQEVTGKNNEVFPNSVFNEATIEDFIENDIFFEVVEPKDLHYSYRLRQARNFGSKFDNQYTGVRLVLADPIDCCSLPYNADQLHDAVVLVLRGQCSFVSKAVKAEKAGALAIIIMDSNENNDELYVEMIDDNTNRQLSIPAAFLLGKSGSIILHRLGKYHENTAIINIPINMTSVAINKLNQPPWIIW